jgi:hypothetical protein
MKRLVDLTQREQITIQLADYPPYHSKYNPVERTFGANRSLARLRKVVRRHSAILNLKSSKRYRQTEGKAYLLERAVMIS